MVQYTYDAWGNHTVSGSNTALGNLNPFRYRGYYYDTDTGFYYLHTRYYDPDTGRFISQDSTDYADPAKVGGLNLYAYCGNNPVIRKDMQKSNMPTTYAIYGLAFSKIRRTNAYQSFVTSVATGSKANKIKIANSFIKYTISQTFYGVDNYWWGRIKYTSSVYTQTEEAGIFYSYVNRDSIESDASMAAGINLWGWFGIEFGVNLVEAENNVYGQMNITPWFHIGESVGGNGLSIFFGVDYNNTSHDITIGLGAAPAVIVVGLIGSIASGGQISFFEWWQRIFSRG